MSPRYVAAVHDYFGPPVRACGRDLAGEAGSVRQGVWVTVAADRESGNLRNVGFRVFGCPHIIALCNRAAELLEGAPPAALRDIALDELAREFEIPVEKAGKLLIVKDALAACYTSGESGVATAAGNSKD